MTTNSVRPVVLRNGVEIEDPLAVVVGYVEAWRIPDSDLSRPASFGEADLRLANLDGARISAVEIAAILERRRAIERRLRAIAPHASLAGATSSVPWLALRQLFDAFADIRGVGCSKMTKALHRKRPALIPMLDRVVQRYLEHDDPGDQAAFGERALGLVRGYKTRPGPQPGRSAGGPAGARKTRPFADRGANPGSPDLVRRSRGLMKPIGLHPPACRPGLR